MPRQSTSSYSKNSAVTLRNPTVAAPKVAHPKVAHPKVAHPTVATPSLLQTVKEGFSFGIGSALAHRVIGGIFGPSYPQSQPPPQEATRRPTEYEQCLAEHRDFGDSAAFCSYLLKAKESPITQG
jgi:hypothetical protein